MKRLSLPLYFLSFFLLMASTAHAAGPVLEDKIVASDGSANDMFGQAVDISGDLAIAGASGYSGDTGAAYIYSYSETTDSWNQTAKLTVSAGGATGDVFGHSVAISEDIAIVSASGADAAYIFTFNGTTWSQAAKLTPTGDPDLLLTNFGSAVDIISDGFQYALAIVGDMEDDTVASNAGAAYIFGSQDNGATWGFITKLTASDLAAEDLSGMAVAIGNNVAIVGADQHDSTPGANNSVGAAWVFTTDNNWTNYTETKLIPTDNTEGDLFGNAVDIAMDGSAAIVGAHYKSIDIYDSAGAAYVFTAATSWSQAAKLTAVDGAAMHYFGESVAMAGDGSSALVGAYLNEAAYLFTAATGWSQAAKITATDGVGGDDFGITVAMDSDLGIIGADGWNSSSPGAAYVYNLAQAAPEITGIELGTPVAASDNLDDNYFVAAAHETMNTDGTVWVTPGQTAGYATDDNSGIGLIDGPAPLTGVSTGWGGLLIAASQTNLGGGMGDIMADMPTNANTVTFGGAQGPLNKKYISMDSAVASGTELTVTVNMKGNVPHLVAIMGGSAPQLTYDPTANANDGELTIFTTTFTTTTAAGEPLTSIFGFMIFTDTDLLGSTPLRIIAQTNSWVGDIFPLLPGWTTNAVVPEAVGAMGSLTAKCGTTIYGPYGDTRNINVFVPTTSLQTMFDVTELSPESLAGFVGSDGTMVEQTTGATITAVNNFGTDGYLASFTYSFASPVDAVMGLSGIGGTPGDLDGDTDIDLTDLVLALKVIVGLSPDGVNAGADVNGDTRIGLAEVIYILQDLAGMRTTPAQ